MEAWSLGEAVDGEQGKGDAQRDRQRPMWPLRGLSIAFVRRRLVAEYGTPACALEEVGVVVQVEVFVTVVHRPPP